MNHTLEPAAPWEQLGITKEEFKQRQAKVIALAAPPTNAPLEIPDATDEFLAQAAERHPELAPPEPPKRKPRRDKGTARVPKAQTLSIEAVSAMTADQAQELIRLVAARNETLKNWEDAQREAQKCEADFKLDTKALQEFIEALAVTK